MRAPAIVGVGIVVLAISLPAGATCAHKIYGNMEADKKTLSVPTTIIAKIVEKAVGSVPGLSAIAPDIEITLEFNARMEFRLDCSCSPCCPSPQKQVASLTVSSSINVFGGTVLFTSARSQICEPTSIERCECPVVIEYERGSRVPAVGVGLSLGGFSVRHEEVEMRFEASPGCGCSGDPRCFGNTAPAIVEVSPPWLDLNQGQSGLIAVKAVDREGNLSTASFSSSIGGPGYLTATLVPGSVRVSGDGTYAEAVYRVEFPSDGVELRSLVPIRVSDDCGQLEGLNVPVRLFYPPVLTPTWSEWFGEGYLQMFVVDDPDLQGCNHDRWEYIEITAEATCSRIYPPGFDPVSCWCVHEECRTRAVTFLPEGNCCERRFTVEATDSSPA